MGKRIITKAAAVLMAVFVAFGMLAVFTERPEAESKLETAPSVLHVGENKRAEMCIRDDAADVLQYLEVISVKPVKASDGNVKYKKYWWKENDNGNHKRAILLTGVKAGKTAVTFTYKDANGNKKTLQKTVTVRKYPNQIKSLRAAGSKIDISKNKYGYIIRNYKKKSAAIKMSLNKGWKVKEVFALYKGTGSSVELKKLDNKVVSGKPISFPKKYKIMMVDVKMTNGNDEIDYVIDFYRGKQ